jgi:uncharacterized protein involved in response to NO
MPIPRYRPHNGAALFSAGFRPFFLCAAAWSALAIPLWLMTYAGAATVPTALAPAVWHVHEMIFGYGAATVAGFMLTAIPNWTGRMPLQGGPLVLLVALWFLGRLAVLVSARIDDAQFAAICDLAFPLVFIAVVAREIAVGRNWRNLPMLAALALLFAGNALVHAEALGWSTTAALGNRLGIATLLMLISLVGGRIVPSFTRNWLVKYEPGATTPASFNAIDRLALALTALALVMWIAAPDTTFAATAEFAAGLALAVRLVRWRGGGAWREPLVLVLHVGYGWLALGFTLLALSRVAPSLPPTAALHALTAGAIGTMTLAVMTRASLGHTGRALTAGSGTIAIYVLVNLSALLRLMAPFGGSQYLLLLSLAGTAWVAAFGLFVLIYTPALTQPRVAGGVVRPA